MNIVFWNCQGLRPKRKELQNCLLENQIDILALNETFLKGELQRENKLISYERAFKVLENDMYIAGIGQVVLELLSFKVE